MTADEIIRAILSDRQLLKIKDKIQSGKGTFEDTAKYSNRASELLGKYFSESVLDISEQERVEACTKLLNDRYDDINTLLDTTQRSIDSKSNLQIKPQHAGFDIDRAVQIGESLIDKTVPDSTIVRRAGSAPVTMSRSMHDDYIKANAEFRNRAGLKCYITRVSDNEPCKWCTRLAGRYEYGQEPDDVYRRHDNCGCTVTYENGRERQNVWTKKKWAVPDKEAGAEPPKVFSKEEAQRLNNEHTSGFVNKMSIDNSGGSGIILGRGSGAGNPANTDHTFEKIGEIDFGDKKAVAKSLQEFEQKYKDSMIEHCRIFCTNGEVYEVHGDLDTVGTTLLGDKLKGSINEHNHVTGRSQYSFSWDDIKTSVEDGSSIVMAFDEKYRYSMVFSGEKIDLDEIEQAYIDCDNEVGDINALSWQSKKIKPIKEEDYQHEVVRRVCERFGVKYERKRKD